VLPYIEKCHELSLEIVIERHLPAVESILIISRVLGRHFGSEKSNFLFLYIYLIKCKFFRVLGHLLMIQKIETIDYFYVENFTF